MKVIINTDYANTYDEIISNCILNTHHLHKIKINDETISLNKITVFFGDKGTNKSTYLDTCYKQALENKRSNTVTGKGIMIIQDLDLYLSYKEQSNFLNHLIELYPNFQIIISCKSPIILSNIQRNEDVIIYNTSCKYGIKEINCYGMMYDEIMDYIFNIPSRCKDVDDDLTLLFDYIDNERIEDAKVLLEKLQIKYKYDKVSDLLKAETMINFLI